MIARGALIKPWLFREVATGYWDITAEERLAIYRRYVALREEHWQPTRTRRRARIDDHGRTAAARVPALARRVLVPLRAAARRTARGRSMQQRESAFVPRSPLEALLARTDDAALDYITDQLLSGGDSRRSAAAGATPDDRAGASVEAG